MANKKKTPKEVVSDQVADEDVTSATEPKNSPKRCLIIPYPSVSEAIHFYVSDDVSRIEGLMVDDDEAEYYVFDRDGRRVSLNNGDWLIRHNDRPYVRPSYDVVSGDDFDDLFLKIPFVAKIDGTVVKANIDSGFYNILLEILREGITEAVVVSTVRQSGDEGCRSAMAIRAVRSLTSEEV